MIFTKKTFNDFDKLGSEILFSVSCNMALAASLSSSSSNYVYLYVHMYKLLLLLHFHMGYILIRSTGLRKS